MEEQQNQDQFVVPQPQVIQPQSGQSPYIQQPAQAMTAQPQAQPEDTTPPSSVLPEQPQALPQETSTIDEQAQPQPQQNNWQYQSGQLTSNQGYDQAPKTQPTDTVQWNASEFVQHERTGSWFVILIIGALLVDVAIYLITRDIFSVIVIGVLVVAVALFTKIKPRVLDYSIGPDGIQVGQKHFTYDTFKSFSVAAETSVPNIVLLPHKRFMVPITMYISPEDGDNIVGILGEYLPFEQSGLDFVDKISAKLRF